MVTRAMAATACASVPLAIGVTVADTVAGPYAWHAHRECDGNEWAADDDAAEHNIWAPAVADTVATCATFSHCPTVSFGFAETMCSCCQIRSNLIDFPATFPERAWQCLIWVTPGRTHCVANSAAMFSHWHALVLARASADDMYDG